MATLADILRQTGYAQNGKLATPAPIESPMTKVLADHIASLPQKFEQNQQNQMNLLSQAFPGNTYESMMTQGDPKALSELAMQVPFNALTAFHGTPHKIKGAFDISKVGTGEGAQAYGHGMYFAEAPQVAETYKRAGGGLEVKYPKPLEKMGINPEVASRSMDFDENPLNQGLGRIVKGLRTTALDYPDVPVDQKLVKEHFDEYIRLLEDKYPKEAAQKKALQNLVAKEGYPEINFGGNLYKVDIPDEYIPNMLDWDKPLNQQSAEVLNAIKIPKKAADRYNEISNKLEELQWTKGGLDSPEWNKLFEEAKDIKAKYGLHRSGEELYREAYKVAQESGAANPSQSAAESLKAQGIPGIRYLDEGSRSKGTGTSNFVVFDPSEVKILEKNSKPVSRKELLEQQVNKLKD